MAIMIGLGGRRNGGPSGDYVTRSELAAALALKQDTLVSGDNIKTINEESLLGPGDMQLVKLPGIPAFPANPKKGDVVSIARDAQADPPVEAVFDVFRYDGTKWERLNRERIIYVSTFAGVEGDTKALYYLDTAYSTYKKGFYRYHEAAGTTPARYELISSVAEVFTDVDTLPTANISKDTIYRIKDIYYVYEGQRVEKDTLTFYGPGAQALNMACDNTNGLSLETTTQSYQYPLADITDALVAQLITDELIAVKPTETDAPMFKLDTNSYGPTAEIAEVDGGYKLYHNPTETDGEYIEIGSSVEPDGVTTEEVNNRLQANAVIDVTTLPTTDIKAKTIYRMLVDRYFEDGNVLPDKPTGYVSTRPAIVIIDENGITDNGTFYAWADITDDQMDRWVIRRQISEVYAADLMTMSTCFKTAANHYVYKSHVTKEQVYELYHNPTETANAYIKIGGEGGSSMELDDITTEEVNNKVQANALIDVTSLPLTDIKTKSVYRLECKRYIYDGAKIPKPQGYKAADASAVTIDATGITYSGNTTAWADVTDSYINDLVTANVLAECEVAEAALYKLSANSYVLASLVTEETYWQLWYNPTGVVADYHRIGEESYTKEEVDAIVARIDEDILEIVERINETEEVTSRALNELHEELQNIQVMVDVDTLPTTDIKKNTLYRLRVVVSAQVTRYELYHNPTETEDGWILICGAEDTLVLNYKCRSDGNNMEEPYKSNILRNDALIKSFIANGGDPSRIIAIFDFVVQTSNGTLPDKTFYPSGFAIGSNYTPVNTASIEGYQFFVLGGNGVVISPYNRNNRVRRQAGWIGRFTVEFNGSSFYDAYTFNFEYDEIPTLRTVNALLGKITSYTNAEIEKLIEDVTQLPVSNISSGVIYRTHDESYEYEGVQFPKSEITFYGPGPECTSMDADEVGVNIRAESGNRSYPWNMVNDTLIQELEGLNLVAVGVAEADAVFFSHADTYGPKSGLTTVYSNYRLYHNPTETASGYIEIGGGSAEVDNVTTEEVNGKVQANAVIEVDSLPTTDIKTKSLYRRMETVYKHDGVEVPNVTMYKVNLNDTIEATPEGMRYKPSGPVVAWDDANIGTVIQQAITDGNVETTTWDDAEFFAFGDGEYDYENHFSRILPGSLWQNRTGAAAGWEQVGGEQAVDEVTIVEEHGILQALAVIDVTKLPSSGMKANSLYRKVETVMVPGMHIYTTYYEGGTVPVPEPVECYKPARAGVEFRSNEIYIDGVEYSYEDLRVDRADWVAAGYIVACDFLDIDTDTNDGGVGYPFEGSYQFLNRDKYTYDTDPVPVVMNKIYQYTPSGGWESISTVELTNAAYNQLDYEQKMDGTTYIVEG